MTKLCIIQYNKYNLQKKRQVLTNIFSYYIVDMLLMI